MTLSTKTMMTAALVVTATFTGIADLHAGGCHSRSYGGYQRAPQPYCHRPTYQQPYRPITQQPIAQPQLPPQGQPQFPAQGQPQGQPQQTQPQTQPQQQPQTQPQQQPQTQPQQQQQQQPQQQPQQPATPNAASSNINAQISALQALAAMTGSQPQQQTPAAPAPAPAAPAQPQASPGHVGTWNSNLANGARVQLNLGSNGSFNWTATSKSGKVSAFQGTYTLQNGSLTLNRSNDNQKLAGAMISTNSNSFNFKLPGAKDTGLNFVRG